MQAWANMAQAYKELGTYDKAEALFTKALSLDASYVQSYHLRALARFGAGFHRLALKDLQQALMYDPGQLDIRHMCAVVEHGLVPPLWWINSHQGLFRSAVNNYSTVVTAKPDHVAWYQREVALFVHAHLDIPLSQFNIDVILDKQFKEAWCKRIHPATLGTQNLELTHTSALQATTTPILQDKRHSHEWCSHQSSDGYRSTISKYTSEEILKVAHIFGPKLQLNSPGYLPNKRQQAACGFAVLELAQRLKGGFTCDILTVSQGCGVLEKGPLEDQAAAEAMNHTILGGEICMTFW